MDTHQVCCNFAGYKNATHIRRVAKLQLYLQQGFAQLMEVILNIKQAFKRGAFLTTYILTHQSRIDIQPYRDLLHIEFRKTLKQSRNNILVKWLSIHSKKFSASYRLFSKHPIAHPVTGYIFVTRKDGNNYNRNGKPDSIRSTISAAQHGLHFCNPRRWEGLLRK